MSELRSIKADVYRGVTELNKAYYHSQSADSTNQKITSDLETSQLYPTGRSASQASSRHNNLFSRHNNSFQTVSSNNMHTEMQFQKISFILLPPKEETLSRRPIFGPNGVDKSTMDTVLPLDDGRWSRSAEESCSSGIIIKELLQVNKIRQPLPPPVLAELKQHDPSQVADPRPGPAKSMQDEIFDSNSYQHLHIPANMMEGFLRLALENTKKNLETCGVLAGKMENRVFHITTLIIPKKEATSDSCLAMKEELLFEFQDKLSLSPLGWIHTHPSQTCAMSSVDLHTQYAYQIMLPEAIAIVMAPSDTYRQHGIFHLSDPGGVSLIRHCQQRGFHAHEEPSDGSPIYEHCSHVYMDPKLKFEIVDLR
ncbi:AMSH-like ubiquitin thioesterase 3 isoform X2 [Papaver somniferum]|nr:AMSH-like ubiquitin thioesterase 3 isoform X2 [Papaver somniferum]